MDWTAEWSDSTVPGSRHGYELNSFANLQWLLAVESAIITERALGNEFKARYWEEKAAKLKKAIVAKFWNPKRKLFADTAEMKTYSEHSQAMALIAEVLESADAEECFRHLVEDEDLAHCTVYFDYYLFEAYFKRGRADLFLKRLDLWRDYVKKGLTTTQEAPDSGLEEHKESRSDCHAWGAHPIYFMQTGLAGIRSAAPWFERVTVAPQPGSLKTIKCRHPHPLGWIEVELKFDGDKATGVVRTPVAGIFEYGGRCVPLEVGENKL